MLTFEKLSKMIKQMKKVKELLKKWKGSRDNWKIQKNVLVEVQEILINREGLRSSRDLKSVLIEVQKILTNKVGQQV